MFATVPQRRLRVLTVTLVTPNDREIRILSRRFKNNSPSILEERAGLSRIIRKIITMPTEDRLKAMARDLAEAEWELVRMTRGSVERTVPMLRPEDASWGKSKEFPLKAIRVDLWEYEFDAEAVRLNLTHPLAVTERVGRFREQAERGR